MYRPQLTVHAEAAQETAIKTVASKLASATLDRMASCYTGGFGHETLSPQSAHHPEI